MAKVERDDRGKRSDSLRNSLSEATKGKTTVHDGNPKPHELDEKGGFRPVKEGKQEHWAYHLLMDFTEANKNINDESKIKEFFKELFSELKIKPLTDIVIKRAPKVEGRGVSAIQMLYTSSIVLHTDDEGMDGYFDVFVCSEYTSEVHKKVEDLVIKFFEPKDIGVALIFRDARPYPKSGNTKWNSKSK